MNHPELQTTCAYCGVGCGVTLPRINDRKIKVKGDEQHPANFGRLCVKGTHLSDVLPLKHRLLFPQINNERVSWETATTTIANKIQQAVQEHGPNAFAFYLSGQLLTEDYYAANKLAKGFLGTANVDTNSRLCMSSAVAAHIRAFGEDAPPVNYEDLEEADLVILVGSNLAWAHPVLFQRLQKARAENPEKKLVVIDPRKSASAKEADLHLAINPGSDGQLFNALLTYLSEQKALNKEYIDAHVHGFQEALKTAVDDVGTDICQQAKQLGITTDDLTTFLQWFAQTPKTVTAWSMGINQSESGVDKSNAIINVHLATGRIGKPGAAPFSITGQPNAMGGREVGGLANQLAVHRAFDKDSIEAVQQFWQAPNMATTPGYKAIDLFDACLKGEIKVLWIMATNPVASLPDGNKIIEALKQVDTVIVSEVVNDNDTLRYADIKLPAHAWGEKDGTITNTERCISRQRGFLIAPGQTRADWAAIAQVGKAMGFEQAFDWHHAHEVFCEHAQLSAINDTSPLKFSLSAVADLSFREYQNWQPQQWPLDGKTNNRRLFSDGQFSTPSGKANMIAVTPRLPSHASTHKFILNTGRLRDQWHTMARTGVAKALTKHTNRFEIHINPTDATHIGVSNGNLCKIESRIGSFFAFTRLETAQQPGQLFAPMHWNETFANTGGVAKVIESKTDPISGQPANKHSRVNLSPVKAHTQGYCFIRSDQTAPQWLDTCIAFKTFTDQGALYNFFTTDPLHILEGKLTDAQQIQSSSRQSVWVTGSECGMTSWITLSKVETSGPDLDFLDYAALTDIAKLDKDQLCLGRSDDISTLGTIVCTCYQITDRQIEDHLKQHPDSNLTSLQETLKCGTNCGSCLPEIKDILSNIEHTTEYVDAASSRS